MTRFATLGVAIFVTTFGASPASRSHVSSIPAGILIGKNYVNETLGIDVEIRGPWAATLARSDVEPFDSIRPANPINDCVKPLFDVVRQDVKSAESIRIRWFAFDPGCFKGADFPSVGMDRVRVRRFASIVVPTLAHTPYIPDSGTDLGEDDVEGLPFILFTGDRTDTSANDGAAVHVNTLLVMTKAKTYWVAWGSVMSDTAKPLVQGSNFGFKLR